MMTPEEIASMVAQASEQGGDPIVTPSTAETTTKIVEGTIIEPKEPEYKTEEQLREEATQLALETERLQEITSLETRLLEDTTLTEEDIVAIKEKLAELQTEEEKQEVNPEAETPEQEIARLKKELEEAKKVKEPVKDPLAQVEAKAKEAGIDVPELYKEYVENGELSAESLKSLLDAGFDQIAIDAYIDTKIVQSQAEATKLISETVGTRETYDAMAEWMRTNLKPEEIAKYDAGVNTEHAKIYIENMYTKYTKAVTPPTIIRNQGLVRTGAEQNKGFANMNEQVMAIADKRYGNDAKYTNEVRTKILQSTFS